MPAPAVALSPIGPAPGRLTWAWLPATQTTLPLPAAGQGGGVGRSAWHSRGRETLTSGGDRHLTATAPRRATPASSPPYSPLLPDTHRHKKSREDEQCLRPARTQIPRAPQGRASRATQALHTTTASHTHIHRDSTARHQWWDAAEHSSKDVTARRGWQRLSGTRE